MRRKTLISFTLLAGAVCAPAFGISPVSAHAPLQGQSPAPNTNVKAVPSSVALLAGEQGIGTNPSDYLSVFDALGVNHAGALAATGRDNATLIAAPVSAMSNGWYAVHWNVASEDGHPMGGEAGSWWAFGVKGTTAKSLPVSFTTRNALPPTGTKSALPAKLSGNRKGSQTLAVVNKWGTVYSVKWILNDPQRETLNGATFTWFSTCKKKTFTCTASGVLPFAGTYTMALQVISSTKGGSSTALWTSQVTIR
jgi:hypothetical protein